MAKTKDAIFKKQSKNKKQSELQHIIDLTKYIQSIIINGFFNTFLKDITMM